MNEGEFIYREDGLFVHLVMEPRMAFGYDVWYLIERKNKEGVLLEQEGKKVSFWFRKSAENYYIDAFSMIQVVWIRG